MAELYPEFFNDVFGPVMQPGSSSHTAAPCRLGNLARSLLGEPPASIKVYLDDEGSFAGTFGLMYEDGGMLAGAMGFPPDDARLFDARSIASRAGMHFSFEFTRMKESDHPNAMKFVLGGHSGASVSLVGDSTGGGMVETVLIDGYPLRVKGDSFVVLLFDPDERVGEGERRLLAASLTGLVGQGAARSNGGGLLYYFKTSERPDLASLRACVPGFRTALLEPVLPVITSAARRPQLFDTMTTWRALAAEQGIPLWEVAVEYEMAASGWSRDRVLDTMRSIAVKMHRQTHAAYEPGVTRPVGPFKPDWPALWEKHSASGRRVTDSLTAQIVKLSYGAGAGIPGVETVPGPMGSGGGYLYAALSAVRESRGCTEGDLLRGLFVAAGIGAIAYTRTEPTGERIGCTGECGICGAMAAAAIAEMVGGSPQEVEWAASLSLQAVIGVPCDPIPGGQGQPCRTRAISAACMAPVFADLALAGHDAVLPLHEAIDVADAVGRKLSPGLLCTSQEGSAAAPTARRRAIEFRSWYDRTEANGTVRPPGNLI